MNRVSKPKIFELLWVLRHSLRTRGLGGTMRAFMRTFWRRLFPPHHTPNPFDVAYGTDTGGLIPTSGADHPSAAHSRDYWGTPPSVLRGALAHWSATLDDSGLTVSDYTFVDLGCGKGRVVMLASELPFAASLGVELNPTLAAIAEANLALWSKYPHACSNLEIIQSDVLNLAYPVGATLLYLFNPFDEQIVRGLAERIADLVPHRIAPIDILYTRPEHTSPFQSLPGAAVLWRGEVPLTREDTASDVFDTTQQDCFLCRIPPAGDHGPAAT